jgi:crotonobetainyl-CoA:carnitine CoA-transferase CaiB-like acyl-CoA transferase
MKLMQANAVAAGAVQNSEDMYYDLQLRNTGYMIDVEVGHLGKMTFDGPPLRLSEGQRNQTSRAPLLAEHNDYVYHRLLGLSNEEVEQLIQTQIIY